MSEDYTTTWDKKDNLRKYLLNEWGYTEKMVDEVQETAVLRVPLHPYSPEGEGDQWNPGNSNHQLYNQHLRAYMIENFQYTRRQLDEIQETGKAPSLKYEDVKDEPTWNNPISPNHYQQGKIQVIDFITDQQFDWLEGNIVKYISRYKTKNGLEDLKKAQFYIKRLIDENS